MSRLTVVTYNTYRERRGRDAVIDELLNEDETLVCLQEVGWERAWEIKRRFGRRAYLAPVMHGWQFLALILPGGARFVEKHAAQLTCHAGIVPKSWVLRRVRTLYPGRRHGWSDGLSGRAVQVVKVSWVGHEMRVLHTHLPYEPGLRDRCLVLLPDLLDKGDEILVGDLNATPKDLFMNDLILSTGMKPAGPDRPTHNSRRRIDYVLYRGGFEEIDYETVRGRSDHRLLRVGLEVS